MDIAYLRAYRFAFVAFVFCILALAGMLAVWVHYLLGPSISLYDLGAPHLRAFV